MSTVVSVLHRLLPINPHQYHIALPSAGTCNAINIYSMTCFKRYMSKEKTMKSPHGHFGTNCQLFPFTTHQLWLIDRVLTKLLQKRGVMEQGSWWGTARPHVSAI